MTAEDLAAIYEASESCADTALVIAFVRAMREEAFANQARVWLDASPEARRAFAAALNRGAPTKAANGSR